MKNVTPGRDEVANPESVFWLPRARLIPGSAFGGPGMTVQESSAIDVREKGKKALLSA